MAVKIVDGKFQVSGFVYYKWKEQRGRMYEDCREAKQGECKAHAISNAPLCNEDLVIFRGPEESAHLHPPDVDKSAVEQITARVKRLAIQHPQLTPSQILGTELIGFPQTVHTQLQEQSSIKEHEKSQKKGSATQSVKIDRFR